MSLETATWITDLDATNPSPTDLKSQGDDHLRLIKSVLKNSIKMFSRAFAVPTSVAKTSNYSVVSTDDQTTITCNTSGGSFTLTLPTLTSTDAGWCVNVIKTSTDANAVWIAPPSGTINGFSKVRRSAEYLLTKITWTGSNFFASRPNGPPVGSCIPFFGTSLPNGYLWPDGSTFTAADYVELNTVLGGNTKPDKKGRIGLGRDDMGGTPANRVTNSGAGNSGISGVTLGASGGEQAHLLTLAEAPTGQFTFSFPNHTHDFSYENVAAAGGIGGAMVAGGHGTSAGTTGGASALPSATDHAGGGYHQNMPPVVVQNEILVAE